MRLLYAILICFAAPVAAANAWLRGMRDPARRERLADRFGRPRLQSQAPVLWVHAASMGEVQASAPLVRRLLDRFPKHEIVMTTMTSTGAARVKALFDTRVTHCYLPYDLSFAVRGFLDRARPELALILETELWPNVLRECQRRRIRVVVASARISPRTAARYARFAALFRESIRDIVIAAQTEADAQRFKSLGASDARVIGNLKFDIEIGANMRAEGGGLRKTFEARFVWVAGSTHPTEEDAAIEAHRKLLESCPNALLIVVPRHPNRFDDVREILARTGLPFTTRSSARPITNSTSILLVDTMGELMNFYAAADAAFVGGSLVSIGGHSLLEPAALALPVLCGPNLANTREAADLLIESGGARIVDSGAMLGAALIELAKNATLRTEMGERAQRAVATNAGVVDRLMQIVTASVS